ncbi:MAG TPA: hypothetical protein VEI95_01675 [Acidobacteriota bacterium]|nr:hypothetical protein [Acidobacteriota bacterium]
MSLKIFFLSLQLFVFFLLAASLRAEEINVYFKTAPLLELLRPNVDAANLSLLITGADGRPVDEGTVAIRLDAPYASGFFSTDMPMVEGTRLNEMRLPLRQGRANWKYLFPIRGKYNLAVDFAGADGRTASKSFQFTVRENRHKWIALAGFSLGLFCVGFIAGRIFTGARAKAVLFVFAIAHIIATGVTSLAAQTVSNEVGAARLDIEPAFVGTPSRIRWSLEGTGAKPVVALTLTITQVEENKIVFAVERIPVAGEFSMNFDFTDGSEHRIAAVAEAQGRAPVKTEQVINVTAVEPPLRAMIPPLSLFMAAIVLGLVAGRWSKRR